MNFKTLVVIPNIVLTCFSLLGSPLVFSDTVNIVSPNTIPPYVIRKSNSGIQLALVKASIANAGHTTKISYASNERSLNLLQAKSVDGMINVPPNIPNMFYSESIIEYQNGAVALKSNHLKITSISDLSPLRVVSFQNASKYFSAEYREMVSNNPRYDELVSQFSQLQMLFNQRCDVIVIDKRIFSYFKGLHKNEQGFDAPVIFYDILPPSPRLAAFNSKAMRDEFNAGLSKLKSSGRYQEIIDSYVDDTLWQKK